uniref:ZF(C2H2)-34 zinc finger protein AEBP2 n=1 Tax=Phallusia mammillata TaxID=59560 RepID=A0A6F9D6L9_9ASCI|nr:ZF(C2H2)-34 zinc finger protein AEBP2 [Phallusia mammillata]
MSEILSRKARCREIDRVTLPRKRFQRKRLHSTEKGYIKDRQELELPVFTTNTSTSSDTTNYAPIGQNTSLVTTATSPPVVTTATAVVPGRMCLNPYQQSVRPALCKNSDVEPSDQRNYHCSQLAPLVMPKHDNTSDEEMIADSPDSGFESTTPSGSSLVDFDENSSKSDSFDELLKESISRTPSVNSNLSEDRLCLIPPPKAEPTPTKKVQKNICLWEGCLQQFPTNRDLHLHLTTEHVNSTVTRFCCMWSECKVYQKPTRNLSCLQQHIRFHTGVKRFQCWLEGCDASFSSQQGLARHVPSHFTDCNLPKAKLSSHNERRYLVKRRRIKDKRKALANVHDFIDQRTVDTLLTSLVQREKVTSSDTTSQVTCKRRNFDGSSWFLADPLFTWSKVEQENNGGKLFFGKPLPRCRKRKANY